MQIRNTQISAGLFGLLVITLAHSHSVPSAHVRAVAAACVMPRAAHLFAPVAHRPSQDQIQQMTFMPATFYPVDDHQDEQRRFRENRDREDRRRRERPYFYRYPESDGGDRGNYGDRGNREDRGRPEDH